MNDDDIDLMDELFAPEDGSEGSEEDEPWIREAGISSDHPWMVHFRAAQHFRTKNISIEKQAIQNRVLIYIGDEVSKTICPKWLRSMRFVPTEGKLIIVLACFNGKTERGRPSELRQYEKLAKAVSSAVTERVSKIEDLGRHVDLLRPTESRGAFEVHALLRLPASKSGGVGVAGAEVDDSTGRFVAVKELHSKRSSGRWPTVAEIMGKLEAWLASPPCLVDMRPGTKKERSFLTGPSENVEDGVVLRHWTKLAEVSFSEAIRFQYNYDGDGDDIRNEEDADRSDDTTDDDNSGGGDDDSEGIDSSRQLGCGAEGSSPRRRGSVSSTPSILPQHSLISGGYGGGGRANKIPIKSSGRQKLNRASPPSPLKAAPSLSTFSALTRDTSGEISPKTTGTRALPRTPLSPLSPKEKAGEDARPALLRRQHSNSSFSLMRSVSASSFGASEAGTTTSHNSYPSQPSVSATVAREHAAITATAAATAAALKAEAALFGGQGDDVKGFCSRTTHVCTIPPGTAYVLVGMRCGDASPVLRIAAVAPPGVCLHPTDAVDRHRQRQRRQEIRQGKKDSAQRKSSAEQADGGGVGEGEHWTEQLQRPPLVRQHSSLSRVSLASPKPSSSASSKVPLAASPPLLPLTATRLHEGVHWYCRPCPLESKAKRKLRSRRRSNGPRTGQRKRTEEEEEEEEEEDEDDEEEEDEEEDGDLGFGWDFGFSATSNVRVLQGRGDVFLGNQSSSSSSSSQLGLHAKRVVEAELNHEDEEDDDGGENNGGGGGGCGGVGSGDSRGFSRNSSQRGALGREHVTAPRVRADDDDDDANDDTSDQVVVAAVATLAISNSGSVSSNNIRNLMVTEETDDFEVTNIEGGGGGGGGEAPAATKINDVGKSASTGVGGGGGGGGISSAGAGGMSIDQVMTLSADELKRELVKRRAAKGEKKKRRQKKKHTREPTKPKEEKEYDEHCVPSSAGGRDTTTTVDGNSPAASAAEILSSKRTRQTPSPLSPLSPPLSSSSSSSGPAWASKASASNSSTVSAGLSLHRLRSMLLSDLARDAEQANARRLLEQRQVEDATLRMSWAAGGGGRCGPTVAVFLPPPTQQPTPQTHLSSASSPRRSRSPSPSPTRSPPSQRHSETKTKMKSPSQDEGAAGRRRSSGSGASVSPSLASSSNKEHRRRKAASRRQSGASDASPSSSPFSKLGPLCHPWPLGTRVRMLKSVGPLPVGLLCALTNVQYVPPPQPRHVEIHGKQKEKNTNNKKNKTTGGTSVKDDAADEAGALVDEAKAAASGQRRVSSSLAFIAAVASINGRSVSGGGGGGGGIPVNAAVDWKAIMRNEESHLKDRAAKQRLSVSGCEGGGGRGGGGGGGNDNPAAGDSGIEGGGGGGEEGGVGGSTAEGTAVGEEGRLEIEPALKKLCNPRQQNPWQYTLSAVKASSQVLNAVPRRRRSSAGGGAGGWVVDAKLANDVFKLESYECTASASAPSDDNSNTAGGAQVATGCTDAAAVAAAPSLFPPELASTAAQPSTNSAAETPPGEDGHATEQETALQPENAGKQVGADNGTAQWFKVVYCLPRGHPILSREDFPDNQLH